MGEYRDILAHNLRRILERRKYTIRELAEMMGISEVMISRWVNKHHVPAEKYMDELVVILEVEMIEFFRPVKARRIRTLRDQKEVRKVQAANRRAREKAKEERDKDAGIRRGKTRMANKAAREAAAAAEKEKPEGEA